MTPPRCDKTSAEVLFPSKLLTETTKTKTLMLDVEIRDERSYHTDLHKNSKCFPCSSLLWVGSLVPEGLQEKMAGLTGEEGRRQ